MPKRLETCLFQGVKLNEIARNFHGAMLPDRRIHSLTMIWTATFSAEDDDGEEDDLDSNVCR